MTIEVYDRDWEQNEELGLNDMKVEGYEGDPNQEKESKEKKDQPQPQPEEVAKTSWLAKTSRRYHPIEEGQAR